jgi:hypothetical protein
VFDEGESAELAMEWTSQAESGVSDRVRVVGTEATDEDVIEVAPTAVEVAGVGSSFLAPTLITLRIISLPLNVFPRSTL